MDVVNDKEIEAIVRRHIGTKPKCTVLSADTLEVILDEIDYEYAHISEVTTMAMEFEERGVKRVIIYPE